TSPREVTTENIARSLGVSRSTYEEHLRKAENRIVGNPIPYLQLLALGEKKPEKMLLKETPLEPAIETCARESRAPQASSRDVARRPVWPRGQPRPSRAVGSARCAFG